MEGSNTSKKEEMVHKVTLSSGKVVLLRKMKIAYQRAAAQIAGTRAGDNKVLMANDLSDEILKILLFQIDDQPVSKTAVENLDNLFEYTEYIELMSVVEQIAGVKKEVLGNLKVEMLVSGS